MLNSTTTEWAFAAIGAIAVLFALQDVFKTKAVLPVMVTLSGVLCVVPEVFVSDVWVICNKPENFAHGTSRIMGRDVAWFSVAMWFAYGMSLITYVVHIIVALTLQFVLNRNPFDMEGKSLI
jgi:hypothetical protein